MRWRGGYRQLVPPAADTSTKQYLGPLGTRVCCTTVRGGWVRGDGRMAAGTQAQQSPAQQPLLKAGVRGARPLQAAPAATVPWLQEVGGV